MNAPFVIGVTNRKGGCGKSTLSCVIGYQSAELYGHSTLLIDADVDQGDSALWMLRGRVDRDDLESGEVYETEYHDLEVMWITEVDEIPDLSKYDVVVIDGRPSGAVSGTILGLADVVIAPYSDMTGHDHAVNLDKLSEAPVFALYNSILGPSSIGKNKKKLVGYDPALRSKKWSKVKHDFFDSVSTAYSEVKRGQKAK